MNKPRLLLASSLLLCQSLAFSYDQVKTLKVIPLADRKAEMGALRLDNSGALWMLNHVGPSIQVVNVEGKITSTFLSGKKKGITFKSIDDFVFLRDGSSVILSAAENKVLLLAPKFESVKKSWIVNSPTAVAASNDDVIAVGCSKENSIKLFSVDGVPLHDVFASEKQPFKSISALAFANDGVLWVLDAEAGQLHRFSPQRKWLGSTEGLSGATAMAIDDYGFAYITIEKGQWKEVNPAGKITGTFGAKGKESGKMSGPEGVAVVKNNIWISESKNSRLQVFEVFNQERKNRLPAQPAVRLQARLVYSVPAEIKAALINSQGEVLTLGAKKAKFDWRKADGSAKSSFNNKKDLKEPADMAFAPNGNLWVADQDQHQLKKVSDTGDIIARVGQKGKKEGNLKNPEKLFVRADSSFVVVDKGASRIQVLSPDGLFLFMVGENGNTKGKFKTVTDMAVSSAAIVIIDDERKAVIFHDGNGKFETEIANQDGKAPMWSKLAAVSVDENGRFYVLDNGSKRVRIFASDGKFVADLAVTGDGLACGPHHTVLLHDEKTMTMYTVCPVATPMENLVAFDDAGYIKLSWDSNPDAAIYNVYKSSNNLPFALFVSTPVPSLVDQVTTPGVSYVYNVRGVNDLGYEGNSTTTNAIKATRRKDISLVSITKVDFHPVFTAAFKFYSTEPIGTIQIENNNDIQYRNVKLSVSLKKYTDFPTEKVIDVIEPGQKLDVPVTMTLNNSVLELTEDTPVQVDIRVSYFEDNAEKSVTQNGPLKLYSRNAISWNETGRIASFITPKDAPIVEFSRQGIRAFLAPLKGTTIPKPLAKAALFFEAMRALNISYVEDPKTPFAKAAQNPEILDYTQFPRETLRRKTGDCDDTTALLSSLLESIGVEVAVIETTGHIFMMANLEESDPSIIGLPMERFVEFRGTQWVPIETTKLNADFIDSWTAAASEINREKDRGTIKFTSITDAHEKYAPVTLVEADPNAPAFPEEAVTKTFPPVLAQLEGERFDLKTKGLKEQIAENPTDNMLKIQLGMAYVEGKKMTEANDLFTSLLKDQSVEVKAAANNNLGNLAYLNANYPAAATSYEAAAALLPKDGGFLINRARVAWRMGEKANAQAFIKQAQPLLPEWKEYVGDMPAELIP